MSTPIEATWQIKNGRMPAKFIYEKIVGIATAYVESTVKALSYINQQSPLAFFHKQENQFFEDETVRVMRIRTYQSADDVFYIKIEYWKKTNQLAIHVMDHE